MNSATGPWANGSMVTQLRTLGKYHILEKLAGGPLAEIYKAKTVGIAGFEKVQVLHRISLRYAQDPAFVRAFIEQAKLAFSLNHRNIVQVFEFGKIDDGLFLATEYIPGVNLSDALSRARSHGLLFPAGLTCYLMSEVASGLEYAHNKTDQFGSPAQIVHCALIPRHVACSWEGSVKILEFGLARAAWVAASEEDRIGPDPRYLAPEQIDKAPLTPTSDIFSFGIILWELLAGRPLFGGDTREDLFRAIVEAPIPRLRTINREVPPELEDLAMACLEREPGARISSAREIHGALLRTQREVGAVIGSRTLATLLNELFSGRGETRDVRQPWDNEAPARSTTRSRETIRHLVDAAAELAEPQNPPAESVSRRSGDAPNGDASERHFGPAEERAGLDESARAGGLLRAPRHPDEEVARASPPTDDALYPKTSDELIPISHEEPISSTRGSATDTIGPTPDSSAIDDDVLDDGSGLGPRRLREKKRFIAACVLLDGPREAQDEALALIEDIAFKLDGLVHLRDEGQLVALFGLPTADENDIVSAARFAFDAQDAVAHLGTAVGQPRESREHIEEPLSARVGIRCGTARPSDRPYRDAYQLQGNALRETLLLSEHVPDGQIYVAGSAARLASMHYILGEVAALRSRRKPLRCYRVVAAHPSQRRDSADNPLVGREIEVKALRSAWRETVLNGSQRTVVVVGDPGVGKSRLVDELLLRHCSDAQVTVAAATPHRRELANALLVDLLLGIGGELQSGSRRSRDRLLDRLRNVLRDEPADQAAEVIEAAAKLLDPSHDGTGSAADFNRRRIYHLMRTVMNAAARHRPLIVLVEDAHWADSSSLECIRALVQQPNDAAGPTFIVVTARPEEGFDTDELAATHDGSHISLEELDEGDRCDLIRRSLRDEADPGLSDEVERRAGGNPLYIRELCQVLREVSFAAVSDIPATVQGVIASRVDRLPPPSKLVLQHAAVIGPTFREAILATLLGRHPTRPLADLRNHGFLLPGVSMTVPYRTDADQSDEQFEREWMFRHVLVQEVIYDSLSSADRRSLHGRVGEIMALRAAHGSTDAPAEVARHLELGGDHGAAVEHYLRAASKAAAGYANSEAERLYRRALELSDLDTDRQYQAYAGLERVHARLGQPEEQAADLKALSILCAGDPARLADLRIRQAMRLLRVGELYLALEAAEQAEESARSAKDEALRAEALRLRAETYERLNDYPRATAAVQEAIEICERERIASRLARAQIAMGRILLAQARYDDALDHFSPALRLVEQTGNRWLARVLRNSLAVVHFCRGDLAQALGEANSGLRLCAEFGDRAREGDIAAVLGIINLALGARDVARRHLDHALALHRETGSRWSEAETLVYSGLLHVECGDPRAAIAVLETASDAADQMGARYIAINARNALALALCQRGGAGDAQRAVDEATRAFGRARSAALTVGEIPGLSRAARATAQLGQLDKARALSRRAVELLTAQRNIEGSEQEIYYTHYRILRRLDDPAAAEYLELAHQTVAEKLAHLKDPAQQRSFCESVRLNAAILRDHQALS